MNYANQTMIAYKIILQNINLLHPAPNINLIIMFYNLTQNKLSIKLEIFPNYYYLILGGKITMPCVYSTTVQYTMS